LAIIWPQFAVIATPWPTFSEIGVATASASVSFARWHRPTHKQSFHLLRDKFNHHPATAIQRCAG
jgi:hypothetical protein